MLRITHTRGRRAPAIEHFGIPCVRIGTAPGSEIAFTAADPGVMPRHAEIRAEGGSYILVDLNTPSGTFVNRHRVMKHRLASGDAVTLGGSGGPQFRVDITDADAEGRVDLDTAQRIVQAAVIQATASKANQAEGIVAAKVIAAQRRASRVNALLTIGVVVALGATALAGFLVYKGQRAASALVKETGIGKAPVAQPVGSIPTKVYSGREIYDQNRTALYVIGYIVGNQIGGCCTAFAIKPDVLATNAHCVIALKAGGGSPIVTQNDSGGKVRLKVLGMQMHPGYNKDSTSADSPDVGLLRIEGKMPKTVTIASDAELRSIGPGDDAFVLGFPGRVMDPISPSATFLQGHIGRTTGMDERPTSPDKSVLIQHDAVTRGGNSGSPIFNQYGHVIGVHAAHLDEEQEVEVGGQKTKVVDSSPFRIGMRIDLLSGVPAP